MCVSLQSGETPLHKAAENAFFMPLDEGNTLWVYAVEEVPSAPWPRYLFQSLDGGGFGWTTFADSSSESPGIRVEKDSIITVVSLGVNSWCGESSSDDFSRPPKTADFLLPAAPATSGHVGIVTSLLAGKASVAIVSKVRSEEWEVTSRHTFFLAPPLFQPILACALSAVWPSRDA